MGRGRAVQFRLMWYTLDWRSWGLGAWLVLYAHGGLGMYLGPLTVAAHWSPCD